MTKKKNKNKKTKRSNKPKKRKAVKAGKRSSKKLAKKKTAKSKKRKKIIRTRKSISIPFDFGNIRPDKERILVLVISIVFIATGMIFSNIISSLRPEQTVVAPPANKNIALEREIRKAVKGYPIEKMTPYIANKDPKTAAFLVAIAKKESNWGKNKPVLNGEDCYNYWGFRLKTAEMGSGGHTCFDSPKEAVDIVATRIDEMVKEQKLDSPRKMVVWKCGSDCEAAGGQEAANKWISDVGFYYNKFSDYL